MTRITIKLASTFLFLCISFSAYTQSQKTIIKGVVIDSLTNSPIPEVSVTILGKNQIHTKSSKTGTFVVTYEGLSDIDIEFSHLSYETARISVINDTTKIVDVGILYLMPSETTLEAVSIVANTPSIRRKIDRIEYNVQNDPDRDIYSVLEILQKVPFISVDGQNKVSLKGKTSFKVLINGKSSTMFSGDAGTALRMMPAKDILRIEVITSPSSKYDSEGISGLINIITKKKEDDGYDATVGASYNYPYGPLGSFNTNLKESRLQVSLLASTFFQKTPYHSVNNLIDFGNLQLSEQVGEQKFTGNSSLVRSQLLYELDSLDLISISASFKKDQYDQISHLSSIQVNPSQRYQVSQEGRPFWNTFDVDLNYQKGFRENPAKFMSLSYKFTSSANAVRDNIAYQTIDWPDYDQENSFGFDENSFQADYESESDGLLIESGLKFIARSSTSEYKYRSRNGPERINKFELDYNVFNAYQTVGFEKGNWSFRGGIRLDLSTFSRSLNDQNTFTVLPSVAIQRDFGGGHTLNTSYNKRIQRPNISQLSPFADNSNPSFTVVGNPSLSQTKGHNFNLSYSYIRKLSVIFDLGYSYTNDAIQQIYSSESDSIVNISFGNVGKERSYNGSLNLGYTVKNVRLMFNGSLAYMKMRGVYKNTQLLNDGFGRNFSFNASIPLTETFRSNLSIRHSGPDLYLQGRSNSYTAFSISLSKSLFEKRLSLFASVNNPFTKFYFNKNFYSVPGLTSSSFIQQNHRSFVFSLSYSFGVNRIKIKKVKKAINNSDQNSIEVDPLN